MATGSRGFTYLGLMLFMVIAGIGLVVAGKVWHTEVQREKERELLFIGDQFRQAIGSYYESTPTGVKQYPPALEDLLHDPRFPEMRRHLRRIYPDPLTGSTEWGLVKDQERIIGVYSQSQGHPLMKFAFVTAAQDSVPPESYADWRFVYKAGMPTNAPDVAGAPGLPDAQVPATPVATPPDVTPVATPPDTGKPDDPCQVQAINEHATCIRVCQQLPYVCSACNFSQAQRWYACKQNRTLVPLVTK